MLAIARSMSELGVGGIALAFAMCGQASTSHGMKLKSPPASSIQMIG